MNLRSLFSRPRETKSTIPVQTAPRSLLSWILGREAEWIDNDYATLAHKGFRTNAYVFRSISLISKSCAGIPWLVYRRGRGGSLEPIANHPLESLIKRPNRRQGGARFIESVVGYLQLKGDSYIYKIGTASRPVAELWPLRPDLMNARLRDDLADPVVEYVYSVGNTAMKIAPEECLHMATWNPLDELSGLSPLEPGSRSLVQNNESKRWNVRLLQNLGKPPGAFVADGELTDTQYQRLRDQYAEEVAGPENAGRPLLLEAGISWEKMGLNPTEMDWLEGQKLSAREIALVYGIPPELIGDSANKTYSNFKEARQAFYLETILPLMDWLRDEFNSWIVPSFDENVYLDYDRDAIEAIQEDRKEMFERVNRSVELGVITRNEGRNELGYDEYENADVLLVPNNIVPIDQAASESLPKDQRRPLSDQEDQTNDQPSEEDIKPEKP